MGRPLGKEFETGLRLPHTSRQVSETEGAFLLGSVIALCYDTPQLYHFCLLKSRELCEIYTSSDDSAAARPMDSRVVTTTVRS